MRFVCVLGIAGMGAACGADRGGSGSGGNPFGNNNQGGNGSLLGEGYFDGERKPPPNGGSGDNLGDPLGEGVCKLQNFGLSRLPPEVMIVLDRSGSMQRTAAGQNGTPTKWSETTAALDEVLGETGSQVSWGMQLYPTCKAAGGGNACAPTPCTVAGLQQMPAFDQQATLKSLMTANTPVLDTGATPTTAALGVAVETLKGITTEHPKFILLATDGQPNCLNFGGGTTGGGEDDSAGAVAAVEAAVAAGYPVYVVGIATAGSKAHATLNQMADAGGRPRDGDTRYYSVANRAELAAALSNIAGQVQNCTFQLGTPPPSPADVAVNIDEQRVKPTDWEYGPGNKSIVVKGEWCEKLKKGDAKKAQIIFGCPGMPIP